ncbi:hypothetical protein [Methanocella sp. MCL-LM]|uniref:hypothetical protein n=1 Tax=Methanocella sp. MCL-LM TaxID=3412035 RepID=UPI003C75FD19
MKIGGDNIDDQLAVVIKAMNKVGQNGDAVVYHLLQRGVNKKKIVEWSKKGNLADAQKLLVSGHTIDEVDLVIQHRKKLKTLLKWGMWMQNLLLDSLKLFSG